MNTQPFSNESTIWVNFKKLMYALMVIIVVMALPVLGYLELTHKSKTAKTEVVEKTLASAEEKANVAKFIT